MRHNPGGFILVHVMVIYVNLIPKHATEAAVVKNFTRPVHSTASCAKITYEQVYDILAKSENSFNIESALYPPKRPSSVRVFVNVYGPYETDRSIPAAKYTWSISSLYAALPARVLEFWSLGAILVNRRTQKLDVTISISGCNVTEGILKKHLEDALAALEDLAIKPTLRDPRLNSAECVMEGHRSDIIATGYGVRIAFVLVCSFIFSVLSGPFLAFFAWQYQENQTNVVQWTMDFVCISLFIILTIVNIAKEIVVHSVDKENVPGCIEAMAPTIVALGIIFECITCWYRFGTVCKRRWKDRKLFFYIVCANLVAHHFCWLVVGIMLNPIWGLFHLFGICLFVGFFSYFVYQYYYLTNKLSGPGNGNGYGNTTNINTNQSSGPRNGNGNGNTTNTNTNQSSGPRNGNGNGNTSNTNTNEDPVISRWQSFYWSFSCVLATICFLTVVVLTGQSYNGKETADEVFKDVFGYLIPFCFAWVCWKNRNTKNVTPVPSSQSHNRSSDEVPLGEVIVEN